MATQDISRFLLQPNKHYSSLHMQQGRVLVDSDWNERAAIEAEDLRATILDVICARGTPNDGFLITLSEDPAPDPEIETPDGEYETYDFQLAGGSYYLGGLRLVIDDPPGMETFLGQSDWLQVTSSGAYMPARPEPDEGENTRFDLVYLHAWEQPVTAIEDRELVEVALGGRDTSTRIKRMRRFMVTTVESDDCPTAFAELVTQLEESGKASFSADSGELVSNGRLRVVAASVPNLEDPCADPTASGYVGADNQTIRVELRPGVEPEHDGKLIWGFDNASTLHRVQVDGTTVSLLTTPQDLAAMPRAGQVVEFLQWGAKLPNGEKVAEAQGLLTVVTSGYDPKTRQLEIEDVAALADWNAWLGLHPEHYNPDDPSGTEQYLYMRVWDRGSEPVESAAEAEIDYEIGEPIDLANTGLQVIVEAVGKTGDFWIVAARPSTPEVVTPWDLNGETGVAPHGPRRFYAPLGLITVTDTTPLSYAVQDCRTRLRKLCEGGACTVTVGDGKKSFGQFDSLQAAVDSVGDFSKICVLPGDYEGNTVISGFEGLIIEGAGIRSILHNAKPTGVNTDFTAFGSPVITIEDSKYIFIRDLGIVGHSAVGVAIAADEDVCRNIELRNLWIRSEGGYTIDATGAPSSWWLPASCVTVAGASSVQIRDCEMSMADVLSFSFALVLGGEALSLRGCKVRVASNNRVGAALGGVNVRSGSRDVEIIDCEIEGGWGHGIALGHGRIFGDEEEVSRDEAVGENPTAGTSVTSVFAGQDPSDCECERGGGFYTGGIVSTGAKFLPAGAVEDVRIYDNRIRGMGLSGVSTTLYWPRMPGLGAPVFIVVTDIDVARNLIDDNVRLNLDPKLFLGYEAAVGGVCLAASTNAWIRENTIRNNGATFESVPICGVGLIAAMNAVVEDNQIVDNGVQQSAGPVRWEQRGLRGGIAVFEATAVRTTSKQSEPEEQMPTFPTSTGAEVPWEGAKDWTGASSQSAVTVRGNEVSHLLGRALWIMRGFGAIVVTGNSLQSYGSPVLDDGVPGAKVGWMYNDLADERTGALPFDAAGACVEISNYGLAEDKPWSLSPAPDYPVLLFVGPGQNEIYGGGVLVAGNRMRLEWERYGGWGASVLVQSLGAVVFNDNASEVVMGNEFIPTSAEETWEFSTEVCGHSFSYSFVLTNVFVGGRASVSLTGNRLTEARWDAVFSALVATPALAVHEMLAEQSAASLALANVGSHCIVAPNGGSAIRDDNVEVYGLQRVVGTTPPYTCHDVVVFSDGVSGSSRLVGAAIQIPAS